MTQGYIPYCSQWPSGLDFQSMQTFHNQSKHTSLYLHMPPSSFTTFTVYHVQPWLGMGL